MKRLAFVVSLAIASSGSPAWAADEFIYLVNATGGSLQVAIDAQPFPPMDHLQALSVRTSPGEHLIAAGPPEQISAQLKPAGVSLSAKLALESAVMDEQKRSFWCFLVARQPDGALRIIAPDPPRCREFIRRGIGDRPLK